MMQKHGVAFTALPTIVWSIIFNLYWATITVKIWCEPRKMIIDGRGSLFLRSPAFNRRISAGDIKTVILAPRKHREENSATPDSHTKFSNRILTLAFFMGREKFLKALKAACPAIGTVPAPPLTIESRW